MTCLVHKLGERCNKSLTLGTEFTESQAVCRIKEWCMRGGGIPDSPNAREAHMSMNPRRFVGVRQEHVLDALAG